MVTSFFSSLSKDESGFHFWKDFFYWIYKFLRQLFCFHNWQCHFSVFVFVDILAVGVTIATLKAMFLFSLFGDIFFFCIFQTFFILYRLVFILLLVSVAWCLLSILKSYYSLSLQILNWCILSIPAQFCIFVLGHFAMCQMFFTQFFLYFKNIFTSPFQSLFSFFCLLVSFSTWTNILNCIGKSDLHKSEIIFSIECY